MGLADAAIQKHRIKKMVEEAMNSPRYQEARKKDQQQAVLQAYRRLGFLMCEILEYKHGYKREGLAKALGMLKKRMCEIGEDETYFDDVEKYYKDTYNLDVMAELGIEMTKAD